MSTPAAGLDAGQRSALERLMIRARLLLERDLATQAEGRFGLHADGVVEEETALPDDASDRSTRQDLIQIVEHLRRLGENPQGAVARLLREAAFTHLNRLVAIRIAETMGLLPESLAAGPKSQGFKDLGEIMPLLAGDYRSYLALCGAELAADAPALFDPRNPLLELEPSVQAFDDLITLVADPATTPLWSAPDTLGWAYQFFNTSEERREMREASAPRNSRELAVRNQFFTPRYVVDFLVQNTIGRRLIESDPRSSLLLELPLLIDPPTEPGPALELDEVKCLDPACGSGHFLLGCYDVLERAWELAGVPPAEAAPKIVASLWGVDIDVRCAQIASAAIIFRARRHCHDLVLPRPNIITARGLPSGSAASGNEIDLTLEQRTLIDRIRDLLAMAPVLGTLLQAEVALEQEVRHSAFEGKAGTLPLSETAAEATERQLLAHLQTIADRASSSVAERLFAAEADDALRLIGVVRQRYDAVLMNPPFGAPVPGTKQYLRAAYPRIKNDDLLAAFVARGLDLCKTDGYLGAITSRAGLFLTSFEAWRRDILLSHRLTTLADLGFGVMEQALVEAAAYVIGRDKPGSTHKAVFIRLLKDTDRVVGIHAAIQADRSGENDRRVFKVRVADFDAIPGAPIAYWISQSIRRLFVDLPRIEGHDAQVRVGLQTGDDFRFVRAFWEVDPRRIGRSSAETLEGKPWCPFAKGGDYSPYWADVHLLVNYDREGQTLRELPTSRVQNTQYYFRAGLTWPRRTNSGFGIRLLPVGCIFADKGPSLIALDVQADLLLLGWLRTRLVQALLDSLVAAGDETTSGGASRSYEVGLVQALPSPIRLLEQSQVESLSHRIVQLAEARAADDATDETSRRFVSPGLPRNWSSLRGLAEERVSARHSRAIDSIGSAAIIEKGFSDALNLDSDGASYLDDEVGPHPNSYPSDPLEDDDSFTNLFVGPIEQLIDRIVTERGGSRAVANLTFVADRRLEVLAHAFRRHPAALESHRKRLGLLPPEQPRRLIDDILSYLVGVAFGRWDIRIGRDSSLARELPTLLGPIPICPPGMLVDGDLPAIDAPVGYPLTLPPTRLLIDEAGHPWDLEASLFRVAAAFVDDPAKLVDDLLKYVSRKTLRDYLRKEFFGNHLARYSKSRRKAPLYWPLTVPSNTWGVWVYAPTLTRETLYAVASEAGRRERLSTEAIHRLQRDREQGASGKLARETIGKLEAEHVLSAELRSFRAEAERIAGLGWEPDLDDGAVLCAAPIADLFPSWPDAKKARGELRKGEYKWSTVAAWAARL